MHTPLRADIIILLMNYLENRCSPAELEQVKKILSEGGYEQEWLAALEQAEARLESREAAPIPVEKAAPLYQRIGQAIDAGNKIIALKKNNRRTWMVAATIAVLIMAGFWVWRQSITSSSPTLETTATARQRRIITLTDGTKIWLNHHSSLRYPAGFTGDTRDVYLEGEAFFEVFHNNQQPFRVHMAALTVQVYGTSFNIKSYQNDPAVSVAVATGKVGVSHNEHPADQEQLLLPGDLLSYDRKSKSYEKGSIGITDVNAWKEGRMVFYEENLETICHALERGYGVTIYLNDQSLRSKKLTLKLHKQESLQNVLTVMQLNSGIRYRQQGNEIWIEKK